MSTPAVHLHAFSAPVVNGAEISVRCILGNATLIIEGAAGRMCDLARDILAAGRQPLPAPQRKTLRPSKVKPLHNKFAGIRAELERDSSHGRQAELCRQAGVSPSSYQSWLKFRAPATPPAEKVRP